MVAMPLQYVYAVVVVQLRCNRSLAVQDLAFEVGHVSEPEASNTFAAINDFQGDKMENCLLYTSPSPRD